MKTQIEVIEEIIELAKMYGQRLHAILNISKEDKNKEIIKEYENESLYIAHKLDALTWLFKE